MEYKVITMPKMKRKLKSKATRAAAKALLKPHALESLSGIVPTLRDKPLKAKPNQLTEHLAWADPTRLFAGRLYTPYNPSLLVTRKGLGVFDSMKKDEQVKVALLFKKYAALAGGWTVESPEDQDEDWEVTRFVRDNLTQIQGGFNRCLLKIMLALDYGYSITEKIFETKPWDKGDKLWLSTLFSCKPHYFDLMTNERGVLTTLWQRYVPGAPETEMPLDKFVVYTYNPEFENHYGSSDLEAAYRPWWIKENAYKWLAIMLERFGMPPIFLFYSQKYSPRQVEELKRAVQSIQNGTMGTIPRSSPDDIEPWIPEIAGQSEIFLEALKRFDGDIAKAILMPSLIGGTTDSEAGSYARSETHFDMFMLVIDQLQLDVCQIGADQIVKPLCDLNFPNLKSYPIVKLLKAEGEVKSELMTTWSGLVSGRIVNQLPDDERHIRKMMKFPDNENPEPLEQPVEEKGGPLGGEGEKKKGKPTKNNSEKQSLYVCRPVSNAAQIIAWAKEQGFTTTLPAEDMHVTVCFSREPMDWNAAGDHFDHVQFAQGDRSVHTLGDGGAVVLEFEAEELQQRHKQFRDEGASWDYDAYHPHITISYNGAPPDLSVVKPYDGIIELGPEKYDEVKEDWHDDIKENEKKEPWDLDWDEKKHPRHPKGTKGGGKFAPKGAKADPTPHDVDDGDDDGSEENDLPMMSGIVASKELVKKIKHPPPPLGELTVKVLDDYLDDSGFINGALRGTLHVALDKEEVEAIKIQINTLDAAFKETVSLGESMTLYRGINKNAVKNLQLMKDGIRVIDPGFISTSSTAEVAMGFGGIRSVMEIKVPKNAKVLSMPSLKESIDKLPGLARKEAEVILPRNSVFKLESRRTVKYGSYGQRINVFTVRYAGVKKTNDIEIKAKVRS
jgi:hypothetical protein